MCWLYGVADLQVPYVQPQENGYRVVTGELRLTGDGEPGLTVRGDAAFSFADHPWSTAALGLRSTPLT